MNDGKFAFMCGVIVGASLFGVFVAHGHRQVINGIKAEAIERGYAQHNPKTGAWEWKEPVEGTTNDK